MATNWPAAFEDPPFCSACHGECCYPPCLRGDLHCNKPHCLLCPVCLGYGIRRTEPWPTPSPTDANWMWDQ